MLRGLWKWWWSWNTVAKGTNKVQGGSTWKPAGKNKKINKYFCERLHWFDVPVLLWSCKLYLCVHLAGFYCFFAFQTLRIQWKSFKAEDSLKAEVYSKTWDAILCLFALTKESLTKVLQCSCLPLKDKNKKVANIRKPWKNLIKTCSSDWKLTVLEMPKQKYFSKDECIHQTVLAF